MTLTRDRPAKADNSSDIPRLRDVRPLQNNSSYSQRLHSQGEADWWTSAMPDRAGDRDNILAVLVQILL